MKHTVPAKAFLAAALLVSAAGLFSCSPRMFSGDDVDKKLQADNGYRKINKSCSNLDLSSSSLDAPTSRRIIDCFNSNGGMPAIAALVGSLSDNELAPVAGAINRYLLTDKKRLFQIDHTFRLLDRRGGLDEALGEFGKLLSNGRFIGSAIAMAEEGYFAAGGIHKERLLEAIRLLGTKLTDTFVVDALDAGITLARSRAFASLQKRLTAGADAPLENITGPFIKYASDANGVELIRGITELMAAGQFYPVIDRILPDDPDALKERVPGLSAVFNEGFRANGRAFAAMTSLFHSLGGGRLSCLRGSRPVKNAVRTVLGEIAAGGPGAAATYISRDLAIEFVMAAPFCELPLGAMNAHFPAIMDYADSGAMAPASEMIAAIHSSGPFTDFLIKALSETGADDKGGIKLLLPLFSEITSRKAWEDLLLVATLFKINNRQKVTDAIRYLIQGRETLDGESIYSVFAAMLSRTTDKHLNGLIRGIRQYMDSGDAFLDPALTVLRRAWHFSDVHPVLDVARALMNEAPANRLLFDTILKIAGRPEFFRAVEEISAMAAPRDGRLRDLTTGLLALFHKFSMQGEMHINELVVPEFRSRARHDLAAGDLKAFVPLAPLSVSACRKIDFTVRLDRPDAPGYAAQLAALGACANLDSNNADAEKAIKFLGSGGLPYMRVFSNVIEALDFGPVLMSRLADHVVWSVGDGRAARLVDLLALMSAVPAPVTGPFVELALPLAEDRTAGRFSSLLSYAGGLMQKNDFQDLLRYVDDIWNQPASSDGVGPPPAVYDMKNIARVVRNMECDALPQDDEGRRKASDARAAQIANDYENAVTGDYVMPGPVARRSWPLEDLRRAMKAVFDRLGDPERGSRLAGGIIRFARMYSRVDGEPATSERRMKPGDIVRWLEDRSRDPAPLQLVYAATATQSARRRVRLANTLDRFEAMILNADIYQEDIHFGLRFLSQMADAWGDEPYEMWPHEIQKKYPKTGKKKPPTIAKVARTIIEAVRLFATPELSGLPVLPSCPQEPPTAGSVDPLEPPGSSLPADSDDRRRLQASIYNLYVTTPVMLDNAPGSGTGLDGGMRLIRDLIFSISYGGPGAGTAKTPDGENLRLIFDLVRLGSLRLLGTLVRDYGGLDDAPGRLARAVTSISREEGGAPAHAVLDGLFVSDPSRIIASSALDAAWTLAQDAKAGRNLGRALFGLLSTAGQMDNIDVLSSQLMAGVAIALPAYRPFIASGIADVFELLSRESVSSFARNMFLDGHSSGKKMAAEWLQDMFSERERFLDVMETAHAVFDPGRGRKSWDLLMNRIDLLKAAPAYGAIGAGALGRGFLDFIEGRGTDEHDRELARRLLWLLGARISAGDAAGIVRAAALEQDGTKHFLETLGRYSASGSVNRFLDFVRKNLLPQYGNRASMPVQ